MSIRCHRCTPQQTNSLVGNSPLIDCRLPERGFQNIWKTNSQQSGSPLTASEIKSMGFVHNSRKSDYLKFRVPPAWNRNSQQSVVVILPQIASAGQQNLNTNRLFPYQGVVFWDCEYPQVPGAWKKKYQVQILLAGMGDFGDSMTAIDYGLFLFQAEGNLDFRQYDFPELFTNPIAPVPDAVFEVPDY